MWISRQQGGGGGGSSIGDLKNICDSIQNILRRFRDAIVDRVIRPLVEKFCSAVETICSVVQAFQVRSPTRNMHLWPPAFKASVP